LRSGGRIEAGGKPSFLGVDFAGGKKKVNGSALRLVERERKKKKHARKGVPFLKGARFPTEKSILLKENISAQKGESSLEERILSRISRTLTGGGGGKKSKDTRQSYEEGKKSGKKGPTRRREKAQMTW